MSDLLMVHEAQIILCVPIKMKLIMRIFNPTHEIIWVKNPDYCKNGSISFSKIFFSMMR